MVDILLVLVILSPIFFIVGIIIAIFNKQSRIMGLTISLISLVILVIGLSICSKLLFRHGPVHSEEEEEENYIEHGFYILKYAPTTDTTFCDPNMILATDFLTGHLYFTSSGQVIHYTNTLGEWDSLRIETGVYEKKEDSLIGYIQEKWVIPYTSLEIHSIEKLDFEKAVRTKIDSSHRFVILKNNNCDEYSYYSKENEKDFVGFVYKALSTQDDISQDLINLDARMQAKYPRLDSLTNEK